MLALLPTINTLLLMWFVKIYNTSEEVDKKNLNGFSLIALLVAAYLMGIIIIEHVVTLRLWIRVLSLIVLILLLASPLWIAIRASQRDFHIITQTSFHEVDSVLDNPERQVSDVYLRRDSAEYHHLPSNADQEMDTNIGNRTLHSGENLNLLQAMCVLDFWILFLAMACGMGSGLATVNNLSQIGGSLGYTSFQTSTLVSLWSIWNFLGRFGAGYVSDYFLHVRGWARPLFMVITLASMSIGHMLIASGFPGALYVGSVLVGVCYGSQWSLMPTITSEIFGVVHMGTIFNTVTFASPIGSYIFSVRVVGYIYDKEASAEKGYTCAGTHCFALSFLIMASATLFGSLAALGLFFRTRSFYRQVVVRKLLHSAK